MGLLLAKLSFPAMAGMMLYAMFSLIDTYFVAKLGPTALAALTLSLPVNLLIISVGSATGIGLTSLISRTLGRGDVKHADNIAWHGIIIAVLYGILFLFFGLKYIDNILFFLGCGPDIFLLSKQYLTVILLGCVFIFIPMMVGNIIQGEGNTLIPMLVALLGIALNVLFDPIFMFGFGPIPGLGIQGAAIATVLAQATASTMIIIIILKRRDLLTWSFKNFKPSLRVILGIYKVGIPTMIMEIAGVFIMILLNRILAGYSYTSVAALGIFLRIRSLVYMPIFGLSQGTMPIAGFAYGSGNNDRVKETILKASAISFILLGIAWTIIQYNATWIISFFSDDPALTLVGVKCLQIATLFMPLIGPLVILNTVFQALGKGMIAMWLSLIRQLIIFIPLLLILPQYLDLNGVWYAFSLSELLSVVVAIPFFIYLWRQLEKSNRVTVFMLFKQGYLLQRIWAWLKW